MKLNKFNLVLTKWENKKEVKKRKESEIFCYSVWYKRGQYYPKSESI